MPRKGYRKPAHEARSIVVNVRLTPQEKNHLQACMTASEVHGMADLIRDLIMGVEIKPRRPNSYAKLIDELARLNRKLASLDNNMNQLARTANSGRIVAESDLATSLTEHQALRGLATDLLNQLAARR